MALVVVTVRVEVQVGLHDVGEKVTVAPVGRPVVVRAMAGVPPPVLVTRKLSPKILVGAQRLLIAIPA